MSNTVTSRPRFFSPLFVKALTIGALLIILLIALAQVSSLISERVGYRDAAVERVRESVGGAQVAGGVIISVPTKRTVTVDKETEIIYETAYVLPDSLRMHVSWTPDIRHSGLYSIPAYVATVEVNGVFAARDLATVRGERADRTISLDEMRLTVLNSEARTLRAFDEFNIGGEAIAGEPGGQLGFAGVTGAVPAALIRGTGDIPFRAKFKLVGSAALSMLPLARTATVSMDSTWAHPKWLGRQGPVKQQIGAKGFTAEWNTLDLARDFGQSWIGEEVRPGLSAHNAFSAAALGVEQYEPVNVYHRNYRAVHYAMLIICITFLTFFLVEHVGHMPIHGMQYLFVGLALAVFYVVLLALSEQIVFWLAYLSAAAALVILLTIYLTGVLRRVGAALAAGAALATLYGLLYLILVSEDYSLIMGALMIFSVLAVLMIATRKFDWSNVGGNRAAG
jgi:inner membrane protein